MPESNKMQQYVELIPPSMKLKYTRSCSIWGFVKETLLSNLKILKLSKEYCKILKLYLFYSVFFAILRSGQNSSYKITISTIFYCFCYYSFPNFSPFAPFPPPHPIFIVNRTPLLLGTIFTKVSVFQNSCY